MPSADEILIVEDEPKVAESLATALSRSGWCCESVQNGQAAYNRICQKSFDVVISDVAMPGMSGLELLDRIVAIRPESRVILITGMRSTASAKQAIRRGAYDYLEKPFEMADLCRMVGEAMADRQREAAARDLSRESRNRDGSSPLLIHRDPLTGLINHRRFQEELAPMRARCRRTGRTMSVMLIDIDDFTAINVQHGYGFGDYVLRELANQLRRVCRESDVLARFGGQVFAIALFETGTDQAVSVARRIHELVAEYRFTCGHAAVTIGVSIGVGECDPGFIEPESHLIQQAHQALEQAKGQGGRSVVSWEELSVARNVEQQLDQKSLEGMTARFHQLNQRLKKSYLESTLALVAAVEAKDPHTKRHSLNVATYAVALGRQLGLERCFIETLETAAILHDLGKIGIPDRILTKPDALTGDELSLVRRHPQVAVQILQHVSFLKSELPMILHHHEWWDGTGYPGGLSGSSIPLGARILHVADSIEAMLATRSYKASYSIERVITELKTGSGAQFDPNVARAAIEWLKQNPEHILATTERAAQSGRQGEPALVTGGTIATPFPPA